MRIVLEDREALCRVQDALTAAHAGIGGEQIRRERRPHQMRRGQRRSGVVGVERAARLHGYLELRKARRQP